MSIWTHPCSSLAQWQGRPWSSNTNAPTWQALQSNYRPFEQLFDALVERADIVRATVNTNYPRLELVQTWTVDAGFVTNTVGSNTTIVATGFPLTFFGDDINGTYVSVDGESPWVGPMVNGFQSTLYETGGEYNLGTSADFLSYSGPASSEWLDGWLLIPVEGSTAGSGEAGIRVDAITTNVVTTNAFSPFPYSVEVDGQTYSGTGFPHLTYAAMEWIDLVIDDLSDYYIPPPYLTNGVSYDNPDGWDTYGQLSLVGSAGVGRTETGTTVSAGGYTNNWEISAYTRQPPVTSQWLMAEWAWDGSNWVGGVYVYPTGEGMDMRLPLESTGPQVEAYTTGGVPFSVDVTLFGDARTDHWWQASLVTGVTESVHSGDYATNLWHVLREGTAVDAPDYVGSTGDYVVVSYHGPIALYGSRPHRLYASDLEERAEVINQLRYMRAPVVMRDEGGEVADVAWTNALFAKSETNINHYSSVTASGDPFTPAPWSEIIPLIDQPVHTSYGRIYGIDEWAGYYLYRDSLVESLPYYPYTGTGSVIMAEAIQLSAQIDHSFTFSTNTLQGTNAPTEFHMYTFVNMGAQNDMHDYDAHKPAIGGQPVMFEYTAEWTEDIGGYTNFTRKYEWRTEQHHSVVVGTSSYLSGRIGHTNWFGGELPHMVSDNYGRRYDATNLPTGSWGGWNTGGTVEYDYYYKPESASAAGYGQPSGVITIIDWGTTNGFRYRAE